MPENNWVWSPTGIIDMHRPERWGYVQFSEKKAGNGEDVFVEEEDEAIKNALWNLFYQQRLVYKKKGFYSKELKEFEIPKLEGCDFKPKIYVTPNLFEIIAKSCDGKRIWRIRQDAKIEVRE